MIDGSPKLYGSLKLLRQLNLLEECLRDKGNLLLSGESGTGKTHIIRQIARKLKRRMISRIIDLEQIAPDAMDRELFGQNLSNNEEAIYKGKLIGFDGEIIFLENVNLLTPRCQVKLLSLIENNYLERIGQVDPVHGEYIFACTSTQPLKYYCETESFSYDLYFSLNAMELHLFPLRRQTEEISRLIQNFLEQFANSGQKVGFTKSAMQALLNYPWPGNVREVKSEIQKVVRKIPSNDLCLDTEYLSPNIRTEKVETTTLWDEHQNEILEKEKKKIITALNLSNGNKTRAAKIMGFTRQTLYNKLEQHGILI